METIEHIFPDYFSSDARQKILENGAENNFIVYRVNKYGKDNTIAFLNYYEETIRGLKIIRANRRAKTLEKYSNDINYLSVSCYRDIEDIIYYYNVTLKKDYPQRILLKGHLSGTHGLSQLTSERIAEKKNSHVDWWLYKNAAPWVDFEEEDDERIIL